MSQDENKVDSEPAREFTKADKKPARRGRIPGRQHDSNVQVRMPTPALKALKKLAASEKASVSQIVRSAIVRRLSDEIGPLTKIAKDETAAPSKRLRAITAVRLIVEVGHAHGTDGPCLGTPEGRGECQDSHYLL